MTFLQSYQRMVRGRMSLTAKDCFALLKKQNVPEHIVEHSRVVHGIALFLCQTLNRQGEKLDQGRVAAGALLHDIAKMDGLEQGKNHSQEGARLLAGMGYPEIGEIIRQHVILDDERPQPALTEASIVHYADKRVRHTTIVSVKERFQDLQTRYGKSAPARAWLEELEKKTGELEKKIFLRLRIEPDALADLAGDGPGEGE
jgi:uncharacterized protein